jgi:hypothetical protein
MTTISYTMTIAKVTHVNPGKTPHGTSTANVSTVNMANTDAAQGVPFLLIMELLFNPTLELTVRLTTNKILPQQRMMENA